MLLMYCTQYQRMLYYNNSRLSKPLVILMDMINSVTSVFAASMVLNFIKYSYATTCSFCFVDSLVKV